jgi:hypothetical protein
MFVVNEPASVIAKRKAQRFKITVFFTSFGAFNAVKPNIISNKLKTKIIQHIKPFLPSYTTKKF